MVQRNMGTPSASERFVVGVDFGTTFTSVAFAYSGSPDVVILVQKWPTATGGGSAYQVPTEVLYTNPITRQKLWGYEIPEAGSGSGSGRASTSTDVLKWFKLLLQERPSGPIRVQGSVPRSSGLESLFGGLGIASSSAATAAAAGLSSVFVPPSVTPAHRAALKMQQANLTLVAVVTDFLDAVRKTTLASIENRYGPEWTRDVRKEYVLTVPAIWSDAAKSIMVKAAHDAGFGDHRIDFNLISEPEAAAAYTLPAIQPNNLECGDTFIICDAGGGTVDLISYKITNLDPLQINESVSGTGAMAGSVFLDERFEEFIRRKLGDNIIDGMKPRARKEMMSSWERKVKFKFGVRRPGDSFEISMPGVADNELKGIDGGFYTIPSSEVKKIFDPIVNYIVGLVKEQVIHVTRKGERVSAILLVGGFGESEYLFQCLKAADYGIGLPIEVLQPPNGRTAIAYGAMLRGLDGSIVKERRFRRNYGCMSSTHFQAGKGWDAHKYWESSDERYMVDEHLNWYITRNEVHEGNQSTSIQFYRMVPAPRIPGAQPYLIFTDELLACDLDDAPDFKWKNPSSIYRIRTITSNLTGTPLRKFTKHTNSSGAVYYRIDFELQMSLIDEVFKFELLFDGRTYGETSGKFETSGEF